MTEAISNVSIWLGNRGAFSDYDPVFPVQEKKG